MSVSPVLAMLGMTEAALLFFVAVIPYFMPTIIAASRRKQNTGAIFALNLLLGWTLLGWVGALVWALVNDKPPVIVTVPQGVIAESPQQILPG